MDIQSLDLTPCPKCGECNLEAMADYPDTNIYIECDCGNGFHENKIKGRYVNRGGNTACKLWSSIIEDVESLKRGLSATSISQIKQYLNS